MGRKEMQLGRSYGAKWSTRGAQRHRDGPRHDGGELNGGKLRSPMALRWNGLRGMRLGVRLEAASGYGSPSQHARVLTETWVGENMYCPACESDRVKKALEGERVVDFACPGCEERFQLNGKKGAGSWTGLWTRRMGRWP